MVNNVLLRQSYYDKSMSGIRRDSVVLRDFLRLVVNVILAFLNDVFLVRLS